ncbi:unnamed protein product [Trichogramma brassicae]|uniref:Uncharacterized protein n=1 Tax=Trichogramma brassicae TaxID=86971 RepID=A0A6H5IJB9_9HYME|nr:unnamed protein product [Trichogramma brassicae]
MQPPPPPPALKRPMPARNPLLTAAADDFNFGVNLVAPPPSAVLAPPPAAPVPDDYEFGV